MTITDEKLRDLQKDVTIWLDSSTLRTDRERIHNAVQAALAELIELRAANTWQPIAPKPNEPCGNLFNKPPAQKEGAL